MKEEIKFYTSSFSGNPSVAKERIDEVINKLEFDVPIEYIEFMTDYNGGEGSVGENGYLILWPIEDLLSSNKEYQFDSFAPGYFVFGQDAADTAYAFEKKSSMIYEFGFLANLETDPAKFCGKSFTEFLEYLYNS